MKQICSVCGKPSSRNALLTLTGRFFHQPVCTCAKLDGAAGSSGSSADSIPAGQVPNVADIGASLAGKPINEAVLINERYEAQALLGTGGMASVYKVKDRLLNKTFALKILDAKLAGSESQMQRFSQEAKASCNLTHPNIVAVYNQGVTDGGMPFLLMDYLDGKPLSDVLEAGPLDPSRAMNIAMQICDALSHAHMKGVVHRDIKPSNIILTNLDGGSEVVKIVDFGIAKILSSANPDAPKLTQTGDLFGSPMYMSPEQCNSEELDSRSDLYSLGCVLYEMLAGKPPFGAENPFKVMLKHVQEVPPPMVVDEVPVNSVLQSIVFRCLEKNPDDRYQNVDELRRDLELCLDGKPVFAGGSSKGAARGSATKTSRSSADDAALAAKNSKHRMVAATAAVFLIAGVGVGAVTYYTATPTKTVPSMAKKVLPDKFGGKTLAEWDEAIEKDPTNADLYYGRGELHAARDERTNSIEDFSRAIQLDPQHAQAYSSRVQMYTLNNEPFKALADANVLVRLQPHWGASFSSRGFVESALEQHGKAVDDFVKSIRIDRHDGNSPAWSQYMKASDLIALGHFQEALDTANSSAASDSSQYVQNLARGMRGQALCSMQRFKEALPDLEANTRDDATRGVEWMSLAYCYAGLDRLQDAEKTGQHAFELETFPARGHRMLGELHRVMGQTEKAIEDFSKATSLEQYPPGYRQRALSYIDLGRYRNALADLQVSLRLNPTSTLTISTLAVVEDKLGMTQEADKHLQQLEGKGPFPPMVLVNQGTIQLNRKATTGALQRALWYANGAIAIDPYLKQGYELRAKVFNALGLAKASADDAAKAKTLMPHTEG